MPIVSVAVHRAIVMSTAVTLSALATFFAFLPMLFPDVNVGGTWSVWIQTDRRPRAEALRQFAQRRDEALQFLSANGVPNGALAPDKPNYDASSSDFPNGNSAPLPAGYIKVDQQVHVSAPTYARFARLSNALALLPRRDGITSSFPTPSYAAFSVTIASVTLILLTLSVIALETRRADVSRAPRGMHAIFVAVQTFTIGALVLSSVVAAHLLFPAARSALIVLFVVGAGSLAIWLVSTRAWWRQDGFLRLAYVAYCTATAALVVPLAYALSVPLT